MSCISNGEDGFVQSGPKTSHYPCLLRVWPQWTPEERLLMEDHNLNSTVSKNNSRRFSISYISTFIYTDRKKNTLLLIRNI